MRIPVSCLLPARRPGRRARFPSPGETTAYLASGGLRAARVALGLSWVIDGGLQFQPFMYTHGWVQQLSSAEAGQPQWLAASIGWGAGLAGANLPVWNTVFALIQVGIG